MRRTFLTLLNLAFVVAAGPVSAQDFNNEEQVCVVTVEGQNQNRTVAGAINTECKDYNPPFNFHDPPFGNWGVSSNYSSQLRDTDQFRGWSHEDGPPTKRQWNSCTTERPKFAPPNSRYYNAPDKYGNPHMTQARSDVVTHGRMFYRYVLTYCLPNPGSDPPPSESQTNGCRVAQGLRVEERPENYMTLYELDWPDRSELVETLYFPATSLTLTSCNNDRCREKATRWLPMTRSTSSTAHVKAELRMKASATLERSSCEWDWD